MPDRLPATISNDSILAALRLLGIDPDYLPDVDTSFRNERVVVTEIRRDDNGDILAAGGDAARVVTTIGIDDEPAVPVGLTDDSPEASAGKPCRPIPCPVGDARIQDAEEQLATIANHLNHHALWDYGDNSTAAAALRLIEKGRLAKPSAARPAAAASADPDFGLGLPGFAITYRGGEAS